MNNGYVTLNVRVTPRSSRSQIVSFEKGVLKVKLAAPPVDGAANDELIKLLAKSLDVRKSDIELIAGAASRSKVVRISGVDQEVLASLGASPPR